MSILMIHLQIAQSDLLNPMSPASNMKSESENLCSSDEWSISQFISFYGILRLKDFPNDEILVMGSV